MNERDARSLFVRERDRFAERAPHVASATLTFVHSSCPPHSKKCRPRDVAWCVPSTGRVYLLTRALVLPRANIVALVRHELGHLVCPSCSEVEADQVAFVLGGQKIRYDGRDIQTVSVRGKPRRPAYLHQ